MVLGGKPRTPHIIGKMWYICTTFPALGFLQTQPCSVAHAHLKLHLVVVVEDLPTGGILKDRVKSFKVQWGSELRNINIDRWA